MSRGFYNAMTQRLWKRLFRKLFIYTALCAILGAVAYVCIIAFHTRIWYSEDAMYPMLHFLNKKKYIIAGIVWSLGILAILFYEFRFVITGLDEVLSGAARIGENPDEPLHFPRKYMELEIQLNETRMKLSKSAFAAKEAEQRKNDLVVYLAHDLKTPLTSVLGYLSLLEEEKNISEELRNRYLKIALSKSERLEELINEFFEITRFNLTHITLEKTTINFTRLIEQLVFEFEPMLAEKNLNCDMEIQKEVMVTCDADKMQRVLDNLLRNAVLYSYPDTKIQIKMHVEDDKCKLEFKNAGATIPKEKLERIFEQFFRLDSSRGTKQGGAGVGLAIAKEIVELHKGSITAESEKEEIRFRVIVPME